MEIAVQITKAFNAVLMFITPIQFNVEPFLSQPLVPHPQDAGRLKAHG